MATRGGTLAQLHDGARRSTLLDREAARRRRDLDGRGAVVTRILTGRRGLHVSYCRRYRGLAAPAALVRGV
jgi:hypothetical protein